MSFFKPKENIYITGPSVYLPRNIVTNEDLVKWMGSKMKPSWISTRTGIEKRHWVSKDESCSDIGASACEILFKEHTINKDEIEHLVLATISGDYPTPPTSPLIQHKLNLKNIGAFDLGAACAGFVSGLHTCSALVNSLEQNHLLVSADIRSKFLSKRDLGATALFGDGASACVISKVKENATFKFLGSELLADGSVADIIAIQAGGSKLPASQNDDPEKHFLKMQKGATLFVKAVAGMCDSVYSFLEKMDLSKESIDWFVPHQANLHLVRAVIDKLECAPEKVIETVQFTGNTSGASVGIALNHLVNNNPIKKGQKVLLISAGGGGLAASALLEVL